jgi:hypothetical protein
VIKIIRSLEKIENKMGFTFSLSTVKIRRLTKGQKGNRGPKGLEAIWKIL